MELTPELSNVSLDDGLSLVTAVFMTADYGLTHACATFFAKVDLL